VATKGEHISILSASFIGYHNMRRLAAIALALVLTFATPLFSKNVGEPKGFDNKVFHASLAMYATSQERGITSPRFICTVTAYKKVKDGYLVIGAGHCTSINEQLPPDMRYYAAEDIGAPTMDMQLVQAELDNTYDYALYFLRTSKKLKTISLGNETDLSIGDETVDVNFSLGAAKIVSPGIVVSQEGSPKLPSGYFLVQQFDSHGASGSAVVSEKTQKIVGIVIAGWDGATMPSVVEGISLIEKRLAQLHVKYDGMFMYVASQDSVKVDVR
jgi:hypothetical protein